jgi:hypothetical protein
MQGQAAPVPPQQPTAPSSPATPPWLVPPLQPWGCEEHMLCVGCSKCQPQRRYEVAMGDVKFTLPGDPPAIGLPADLFGGGVRLQ